MMPLKWSGIGPWARAAVLAAKTRTARMRAVNQNRLLVMKSPNVRITTQEIHFGGFTLEARSHHRALGPLWSSGNEQIGSRAAIYR
jgi:hypothetical protein